MLLSLDHKISKLALRLEKACAGNRLSGWPARSTWTDVMQHLEVRPAGPAPVEEGPALPRPLPCCALSCLPACPLRVILSCAYRSLHLTNLSFCQFRGWLWRATRSPAPAAMHDAHCNSAACLARAPSPVPAACVLACLRACALTLTPPAASACAQTVPQGTKERKGEACHEDLPTEEAVQSRVEGEEVRAGVEAGKGGWRPLSCEFV